MSSRFIMLLASASFLALTTGAYAQERSDSANLEEIVVTGSRVIANGDQAPTPLTVISTESLAQSNPAGIARAIVELPMFAASDPTRGQNQGDRNSAGAYLNLRQVGSQRNLILMDGIRVSPTTADGRTDINILPQGLIQRVDIVTGGVSAVYGSDAVTGVINFVLDHEFNGLKAFTQYGISDYGDGHSWRGGLTAGSPIFGDRGHIEGTFEYSRQKSVADDGHRHDLGGYPNFWTQGGAGTAAAPFVLVPNSRSYSTGSPGGVIKTLGTQRDINFKVDGVPTSFNHGGLVPGSAGLEIGGDGAVYDGMVMVSPLTSYQGMGRFDYELTENTRAYVQASFAESKTNYPWHQAGLLNKTVFSGNPFIPTSIQQFMTANNIASLVISKLPTTAQGYQPFHPYVTDNSLSVITGLNGNIGEWNWKADYSYSHALENVINANNLNQEKLAAALDAVRSPSGQIVCASARFSDCQPLNMFGPTAASLASMDFVQEDTEYHLYNVVHDVNLSVSGSPFALPAGPVVVALSAEYRKHSLTNESNADPGAAPDCTGIRAGANCTATKWFSSTTAPLSASLNVKEGALETQLPLLKELPLIKSLALNLAARYTQYSTSGSATTWKAGTVWDLTSDLRVRATRSRDIRAPTLFDLYRPLSTSTGGFVDPHTKIQGPLIGFSQGNPNLKPEVANTTTVGVVYKPGWMPGLSIAIDYYTINLAGAIASVNGNNVLTAQECENSGGTSPFCANLVRPLPFSDYSAANFPTRSLNQNLNVASLDTHGLDIEASYKFELASLFSGAPGSASMRMITNYQPTLRTVLIPSQPPTENAGIAATSAFNAGFAKWRVNMALGYAVGAFDTTATIRWQSGEHFTNPALFVDSRPDIPAYTYVDLSLNYGFGVMGHDVTSFLTVKNLFDKDPPITGQNGSFPGALYPAVAGYDVMGRYYTLGLRARW